MKKEKDENEIFDGVIGGRDLPENQKMTCEDWFLAHKGKHQENVRLQKRITELENKITNAKNLIEWLQSEIDGINETFDLPHDFVEKLKNRLADVGEIRKGERDGKGK
jgi:predicted nuclease with TOPRIM domain